MVREYDVTQSLRAAIIHSSTNLSVTVHVAKSVTNEHVAKMSPISVLTYHPQACHTMSPIVTPLNSVTAVVTPVMVPQSVVNKF